MDRAASPLIQLKGAARLLRDRGLPATARLLREACVRGDLEALKRPRGRRWFVQPAELVQWADGAFSNNLQLPRIAESELARLHEARTDFEKRYWC